MPSYHVYIKHYNSLKSNRMKTVIDEAYELDLSKEELIEQIVKPFISGRFFMCGGQQVNSHFVELIRITETDESSSKLILRLKAEEERKSAETGLEGGVTDNYLIIESGTDVTRKFISKPAGTRGDFNEEEKTRQITSKNIFIVHGADHEPMKELKAMLYEFGLNPIVLHEQPSGSRTIVEKLEKHSNVGYAFIVLTPDDVGASASLRTKDRIGQKTELIAERGDYIIENSLIPRARQNVILEFGYFIGLLGRDRVCCLHKGDVELPSDMHGIVYIPFKDSIEEIRLRIMKELKEAGYKPRI